MEIGCFGIGWGSSAIGELRISQENWVKAYEKKEENMVVIAQAFKFQLP